MGALLLAAVPARAADWPRWRGPLSDGRAGADERIGVRMAPAIAWQRPLGIGYSAIVVAGGRAVTLYADAGTDFVAALDAASGELVWRTAIDAWLPPNGGSEGGAKSTPTIARDVVYALGPKGHLLAVRVADGAELWRRNLVDDVGAVMPEFGFATSPVVAGDVVAVQIEGGTSHSLVGFDGSTGALRWSVAGGVAEYESPLLTTLAGTTQLVVATDRDVRGVDPASGAILWSHPVSIRSVPMAVPAGDDAFVLAGEEGAAAFRIRRDGDGLRSEPLWTTSALKGSLATPVAVDGFLFGYDGEFLACVSLADGTRRWKSRPPGGRGLIAVDGRLVIGGTGGVVAVAEATPDGYHELARVDVFDRTGHTYPTFADGRVFLRNTREAASVTLDGRGGAAAEGRLARWARIARLWIARPAHAIEDRFWQLVREWAGPGATPSRR